MNSVPLAIARKPHRVKSIRVFTGNPECSFYIVFSRCENIERVRLRRGLSVATILTKLRLSRPSLAQDTHPYQELINKS